jgi:hypothetical protein
VPPNVQMEPVGRTVLHGLEGQTGLRVDAAWETFRRMLAHANGLPPGWYLRSEALILSKHKEF